MANKNLFQRIFGSSEKPEIKQLKERLDQVTGEFEDKLNSEVKFVDAEPSSFSGHYGADFSGIDQQVDNAALQRIYSTETWVYTAVNAIAKTVSSLPLKLEKRKLFTKKLKNEITGEEEAIKQEVWMDASGEKLNQLFQHPNEFSSKSEFLMLLTIDLLTCGEAYVHLDSDSDLQAIAANDLDNEADSVFGRLRSILAANTPVKGLYRIPPSLIKPMPFKDRIGVENYMFQSDKVGFCFEPSEIVHIKLPNPSNPYVGLSPLIAAFKPVLLDRFTTEHMIRFYKSGARLGGVLETDKNLTKEQMSRYQRSFESGFTGRHNHHRTLILPAGMNYKSIEQNPAETALLEFCKYNRETLLAAYNVPPIKVGVMDNANYANAFIQLKMFFSDTIIPILVLIEDAFNLHKSLMPDNRSFRIKFDLNNVEALQENFKDKADAAKSMLEAAMSINEVRKKVWNLDSVEEGDVIPSLESSKSGGGGGFGGGGMFGLSAPKNTFESKDAVSGIQADTNLITSIKPTDVTFAQRVSQLVAKLMADGIALDQAIDKAIEIAKVEGFSPLVAPVVVNTEIDPLVLNHIEEQKEALTTSNNPSLIQVDIGPGKPLKPCSCDSSTDTCNCPVPKEKTDSENESSETGGNCGCGDPATSQEEISSIPAVEAKVYPKGFTKDHLVNHWKGFIEKTDPLILARQEGVIKFFKKFKTIVMNRFGANLKSYGAIKARNPKDADEILSEEAFDKLISEYVNEADQQLMKAYEQGYADTLVNIEFDGDHSQAAKDALRQYAASRITGISDTTRERVKNLLLDKFEKGASVSDIGTAINAEFDDMEMGRAMTIARTETLTAVSIGKQQKRQQVAEQLPGSKIKKMWVTAKDDRVRDAHEALEGEAVDQDAKFSNGLEYPRDPNGEASEVINCRCDVIDFIDEDEAVISAELSNNEDDLETEENE